MCYMLGVYGHNKFYFEVAIKESNKDHITCDNAVRLPDSSLISHSRILLKKYLSGDNDGC